MRSKLFHFTSSCLIASGLIMCNAAQAAKAKLSQAQEMQEILQEMHSMQRQVSTLNTEVKTLKRENRGLRQRRVTENYYPAPVVEHHHRVQLGVFYLHEKKPATGVEVASSAPATQQELTPAARANRAVAPAPTVAETAAAPGEPVPASLEGGRMTQGVTVTTSPLLGLRSAYDALDLTVNLPTMNEDLRLLKQRHLLETELKEAGIPPLWDDRPVLELSGALESQAVINKPFLGRTNNDIDLTRAEFDTLAYFSPGITGLMSFTYDNSQLPANIQGSAQRFANSRLYLKRGFVTVGDLGVTPFYFSIGQMYAPFGRYYTEMLSNPMTQTIGQTINRIALLGFYDEGLYAEGYIFRGDAGVGLINGVNNGGANLGYQYNGENWGFGVGAGYIRSVADSLGIQKTGADFNSFQGFAFDGQTEDLQQTVPGDDFHATVHISNLTLVGEFVGVTRPFNEQDLSYNFDGARPQALHLEGDYSFKIVDRFPSVFSLAFDRSWEALGLNVPQKSYTADLNMSFFKNTIETLEYRHDENYPSSDYSGGNNNGFGFTFPPIPVASVGGSQNTVIAQIGAYF